MAGPRTIPERSVRLSPLCVSQTGYRNLSQLITGYKLQQKTKGEGFASWRMIEQRAEGLVCLTGGDEGTRAVALARGGMEEVRRTLETLVRTFGQESGYIEIQRHRIREQDARNQACRRAGPRTESSAACDECSEHRDLHRSGRCLTS